MSSTLQDKLAAKVAGEKPTLPVDTNEATKEAQKAAVQAALETEEPPKVGDADDLGAWKESTIQEAILKTAFAEAASYTAPEGSFKNNRLHQVVLKNGEVIKPNKYGYYEGAEGEALQLLEYYANTGLVSKVTSE